MAEEGEGFELQENRDAEEQEGEDQQGLRLVARREEGFWSIARHRYPCRDGDDVPMIMSFSAQGGGSPAEQAQEIVLKVVDLVASKQLLDTAPPISTLVGERPTRLPRVSGITFNCTWSGRRGMRSRTKYTVLRTPTSLSSGRHP